VVLYPDKNIRTQLPGTIMVAVDVSRLTFAGLHEMGADSRPLPQSLMVLHQQVLPIFTAPVCPHAPDKLLR
jgi:hypothetical protein